MLAFKLGCPYNTQLIDKINKNSAQNMIWWGVPV